MHFFPTRKIGWTLGLILLLELTTLGLVAQYQGYTPSIQTFALGQPPTRGLSGDLWADTEIGKRDFTEISAREIVPYKLNSPGGVVVDRSVSPGRLYVWDSGNNRILGIDLAACYGQASPCTPQLIFGQPSGSDYGACNQDASFQYFPDRAPASASTLCGVAESTITTLEDKSFSGMYVDSAGNLYVPDVKNHRILQYNSPFTTDTIADDVWGQSDFAGNLCNRGGSPAASTFCFLSQGAFGSGVMFDAAGNMWVADGGNNRVLRFPVDGGVVAKTADLVLGQPNFTFGGDFSWGTTMDRMHGANSVTFDAQGALYVADSHNNRVLVFSAPFTNGMAASATFGSGYANASPYYIISDPQGRGIWTFDNEGGTAKLRLRDATGTVTKELNHQSHGGGSISFDTEGNILTSTYVFGQDVHRWKLSPPTPRDSCSPGDGNVAACNAMPGCAYYFCSNRCWLGGTPLEIGCGSVSTEDAYVIDKNLFSPPGGYNLTTNRRLEHAAWVGVAVTQHQLVVADSRLLFWNSPSTLTNGKAADGFVGASSVTQIPNPQYMQLKSDASQRVWALRLNSLEVYQTPMTTGATPLAVIGPSIPVLGGGNITLTYAAGVAVTPNGEYAWISEPSQHRVYRVRSPLSAPMIDIILGQQTVAGNQCNRGIIPAPNTGTQLTAGLDMLCFPGMLSIDRLGNLFVSDHYLEIEGNNRMLMFRADTLPALPDQLVFAPAASKSFPRYNGAANMTPHAYFEPAFDSANRMVVGLNPYQTGRSLFYYNDPLRTNPSDPSDPAYAVPDGQFNDYYAWAVAMTFDDQDNLYAYDANRGKVMIYKQPFPPAAPTLTPSLTPEPTLTPSLTPTRTPTRTPSPTPTRTPTPVPVNLLLNAGFELDANGDNRPDSWSSNSRFTRSNAVIHGGSFAGRHFSSSNTSYSINQTVPVTAGRTYTFSGWTNIPATSDSFTYRIQLRWRRSNGNTISTTTVQTYSAATSGWTQVSKSYTAPSNAAQAQIIMDLSSLKGPIYVDDFELR